MNKIVGSSIWIEQSDQVDKLSEAAALAFGQIGNVVRNKASHFAKKGKDGALIPDYADLASCFDAIRTAYSLHGLSIRQTFHPHGDDGTISLVTTVRHKSGQFERSYLPMKSGIPPQELAKTATYLKRIALCAIVGVAADDDDDGMQANASHEQAAASEEKRIERALNGKVRSCRTSVEVEAVLAQAERGVSIGQLGLAALGRIKLVAAEWNARLLEQEKASQKKPSEKAEREAVPA